MWTAPLPCFLPPAAAFGATLAPIPMLFQGVSCRLVIVTWLSWRRYGIESGYMVLA
jgi:hypothetical protein